MNPRNSTLAYSSWTSAAQPNMAASIGGTSPRIGLYDTFDVNDRLAQAITLVALPASQLRDGQTFSILTLYGKVTFEFDTNNSVAAGNRRIAIQTGDSAATVATRIRDAINNVPASEKFDVKAGVKLNGARVNLFGPADVDPGPLGRIVFDSLGDTNPTRTQGYTILQGNKISNTLQAGIVVQPVLTFGDETNPFQIGVPGHTGSLLNLPTLNSSGFPARRRYQGQPALQGRPDRRVVFSGSPTHRHCPRRAVRTDHQQHDRPDPRSACRSLNNAESHDHQQHHRRN